MKPRLLLVYPNLPLMMAPSIAMGLFNAIGKREGCEVEIFETTQYSESYSNKHIRMTEIGAARPNKIDEVKDMFYIQPTEKILPDFIEKCKTYKPDILLISVQEDVWGMTLDLLDSVKDMNIPHILGGIFPTSAPEVAMSNPLVKMIALHEGERTVEDAINCIKQNKPLTNIKGTWWKDDVGLVHKNPPQPLTDIGKVTPDFTCFEDYRWQRPMGGRIFKRVVSMETYRGCPYNCTFCNSPYTRDYAKDNNIGNYLRRKSVHCIERDFEYYRDLYNPELIMFQDDSFLARPKKEVFDFCEMWSKHKTPFWFNTRIENCKPDLLAALKEAGCYRMTFGLESGNETYRRDFLGRDVSNDTYLEHFDYINDSNIPYSLNVIIGLPFETRGMVMDSARMVNASKGYDGLSVVMMQFYHGTESRRVAVEAGFLDPNHINGYGETEVGGGYLDHWALKMPAPYLQEHDVKQLLRTFCLYAYFPESMWDTIREAETDSALYSTLMDRYRREFFADIQQGGADRIKLCGQHDATSTYEFSTVGH